jgi:hypothetical protein
MNRKLTSIAVALVTCGLSVALVTLLHSMAADVNSRDIPQQQLIAEIPCFEEETAREFSAFWWEFRSAVEREDKTKLFSMTRKCNFDWSPFRGEHLIRPLEINLGYSPSQLEAAFEVRRTLTSGWGHGLRFGANSDFLANYQVIFSNSNRLHFTKGQPGPSTECEYAISWRERALNHLCFDRVGTSGYKFSGLIFEP